MVKDRTTLFNGKDLTGWTVKCVPADRDKEFWRVEDGTILADSLGHIALQIHRNDKLKIRFKDVQIIGE